MMILNSQMKRKLSLAEIREEEQEHLMNQTNLYLVAFIASVKEQNDWIASGTLVQINGKKAILTASHVCHGLEDLKTNNLRLVYELKSGVSWNYNMTLNYDRLSIIIPAESEAPCKGPDIGLIYLSEVEFGTVASVASFFNMDLYRDDIANESAPPDDGFWMPKGLPQQSINQIDPFKTGIATQHYRTFLKESWEQDGFDYYDLEASLIWGPNANLFNSNEGLSGGGLWHVKVHETIAGKPVILREKSFVLSGVMFYQKDPTDETGLIRCHGRQSLYKKLYESAL